MLQITILWYALFTFLSGFAQNAEQLFMYRALQGFGFGGEWATGAVLIGEVIRDKYRGRAVGVVQSGWAVGWGAAAIVYTIFFAFLPETIAWRSLFWVGLAPALLVFWIRKYVEEPEIYRASQKTVVSGKIGNLFSIFKPPYLGTTIKVSLMVMGAQGGAYAVLIWLPTYLKTVRALSAIGTGSYLLVHILGAFLGFLCGAYLADAVGRKTTFFISVIGSMIAIVIYLVVPIDNSLVLVLGFPLGFVIYLMFAPMGPFMTELYPTQIRGAGQGFCYNSGRAFGALFPALVGFLADRMSLGYAIAVFSLAAYAIMALALILLPETKGREISDMIKGPLGTVTHDTSAETASSTLT
jgi:MFS family permease